MALRIFLDPPLLLVLLSEELEGLELLPVPVPLGEVVELGLGVAVEAG